MNYKKIVIETDGTSMGTKIFIDDVQVGLVQSVEFSADVDTVFAHLSVKVCRKVRGEVKKKTMKVRDQKTEKFVDKEEIETETMLLVRSL